MKVDIIGAGSLGMLIAGRLAAAGTEIRLWCRSREQSEALEKKGLVVSYEDGREPLKLAGDQVAAEPASGFAGAWLKEPGQLVVLAVKQNALQESVLQLLTPLKDEPLRIVCLQNGYGHIGLLQSRFPSAEIWAAVTTEAAKRKNLIEVIHTGSGEICIGKQGGQSSGAYLADQTEESGGPAIRSFVEALNTAGFSAYLSNEVDNMIYRKLLINAVINPLTAIWRIPNGELLHSEKRMHLMKALYDEITAVYEACGIPYDRGMWEKVMEVCLNTAANTSSMLADVMAARPTEIRWINGSIVDLAQHGGVEAPMNVMICRLLEGMNAKEG
ncbi:ketopantoate reductase family protein ['Paenibacillus yunnanensis' Narsing Rao et al. 2020]|uniref:ketopantoate reductase family protein n=1 Tax=Paenibacillus tengchongensis TaxID=2608684 RepID=UPI00124F2731|nr:ketopantoate reductase family protein [Paenibacillus tengchongensis]